MEEGAQVARKLRWVRNELARNGIAWIGVVISSAIAGVMAMA